MEKCKYYKPRGTWDSRYNVCVAIQDCKECTCCGNEIDCDFYVDVRQRAKIGGGIERNCTVGKLIEMLSKYPKETEIKVSVNDSIKNIKAIKNTGVLYICADNKENILF